jgi:glycerol-3-phosphate acyltransferase PlsY
MLTLIIILGYLLPAYLIGSIPNAVWIGKLFYGVDVRNEGSKNAGTTNVIRVLGLKPGLVVLTLDLLKGIIPLALFMFFVSNCHPERSEGSISLLCLSGSFASLRMTSFSMEWLKITITIATVIGHVFPIFAGFRGGKGVATLVGVLIMLYPQVFLLVAGVFFAVFFLFRYISLSSICAAISLPLLQFAFFQFDKLPLLIFAILIAIFVPFTHIKNIKRLFRKEEPKFKFKKHI